MPPRTCLEKASSCRCGRLRVCGHARMISPVIVKCELGSSQPCESYITLPHSASGAAEPRSQPSSAFCLTPETITHTNTCVLRDGPGVRGSCFHSLVAHGPTLAALVTPPRGFVPNRRPCVLTHVTNKTHSWLIIRLKLSGRGLT